MLVSENRWRAQRYGINEGLVDYGRGEIIPYAELVDELIDLVGEDADAMNCTKELMNLKNIIDRGTSAHRQVQCFDKAIDAGHDTQTALIKVVDHLISETRDFS